MSNSRISYREVIAAAIFYTIASYLLYWPVFNHPGHEVFLPFNERMAVDVELVLWIQSTIAHNLTSRPFDLFSGNAFHPDPIPIARSEHLLSQQVTFAPLYFATGNPVLAQQLTTLLNIAACGVGLYLLLRNSEIAIPAALLAGLIYAAFPGRYFTTHAPHVSAVQYLPLSLLFLDRALTTGRGLHSALFGLFLTLQLLTSFYLAYVTAFFVSFYTLGRVVTQGLPRPRTLIFVAAAGLSALGILLLVAQPYLRLASSGGLPEHNVSSQVLMSNVNATSYLYPPIAVRTWKWPQWGLPYYLGLVPLALAFLGTAVGLRRWRSIPVVGLLLATFISYLLAMGPPTSPDAIFWGKPFQWAADFMPGFSSIRAPGRFAMGVLVGVAALAGIGADALFRALARRGAGTSAITALAVLLAALTATEFGIFHFRHRSYALPVGGNVPPVYRALRDLESGPVIEVPGGWLEPFVFDRAEARYSYLSIYHEHEMLNGYTGYKPRTYDVVMGTARSLPEPRAIDLLRKLTGLRYIILHDRQLSSDEKEVWTAPPGLTLIGRYGRDRLFSVPPGPATLMAKLLSGNASSTTVMGTRADPLPRQGMRMEITAAEQWRLDLTNGVKSLHRGPGGLRARVTVTNRSDRTWPALTLDRSAAVRWYWYWQQTTDAVADRQLERTRPLAYDLAPGEESATTLIGATPKPGTYDLTIGLRQGDRVFPNPLRIEGLVVRPRPARPSEPTNTTDQD